MTPDRVSVCEVLLRERGLDVGLEPAGDSDVIGLLSAAHDALAEAVIARRAEIVDECRRAGFRFVALRLY